MARLPRLAIAFLVLPGLAACHDSTGPGADLRYASVTAGANFSCALTRDGRAFCWGDGFKGQLGRIVDSTYASAPVAVSGGHRFTALASGDSHACGLSSDGSMWCWGLNASGQLGGVSAGCSNVITTTDCSAVPVQAAGGATFTAIGAGGDATCGVTAAGTVMCWGQFWYYALHDPTIIADSSGSRYAVVAPAGYFACALTSAGAIRCAGDNGSKQLGSTTVTSSTVLIPTVDTVARTAVTANNAYACALDRSGAAACWGTSQWATLGKAGVVASVSPVAMDSGLHFTELSAGLIHACGVATDGSAWCWGSDSLGMLGHNTVAPTCGTPYVALPCQQSPVRVTAADAPYASIAAGQVHTCAVTQAGTAWCWGGNTYGNLGNGTTTGSRAPVQVLAADTTR